MDENALLHTIRELETALHQPAVRRDRQRLNELIHPAFLEFGRSGGPSTKADILSALPLEKEAITMWSQEFALQILAEGIVLLTYKSAQLTPEGTLARHALRASIWQRSAVGWQMRFHQGTPTAPFDKDSP